MTTSSSSWLAAVLAFFTDAVSSGPSGRERLAGTTSTTASLCCRLASFRPLASGAGVFLGLVGILTSSEETPLTDLPSASGSLLWRG